jgi:hypothetical protein
MLWEAISGLIENYGHGRDAEADSRARRLSCRSDGQWRVPVFEAIDPGINADHPFALVVAFLNTAETDPYGRHDVLEVFHAFKTPDTVAAAWAEHIFELRAALGYQPQFTVIDPSAKNRNPETGRKLQEALRREGIHTVLGQNDRALTYAEIRGRLTTIGFACGRRQIELSVMTRQLPMEACFGSN